MNSVVIYNSAVDTELLYCINKMWLAVITDNRDHTHRIGTAGIYLVEIRMVLDYALESTKSLFLDI